MLQWPWLDREVCLRVALVLWHVAWSGALLSGASLLAARWIARTSRARHALYCGTLAAMALLVPAWGFATSRTSPDRIGREVPATNRAAEVTAGTAASDSAQGDRSHAGGAGRAGAELESGVDSTRAETSARKAPERLAETTTVGAWELAVQGITVAYAAGLLLMLVRLVAGVWGGERLRSAGRPVESPAILSLLAAQARRLGLKVVPALRTCERVAVPVVVGLLKPVVLIPAGMLTGLSQDQLETVLAHELAHLRRHDHLVLLGQRLIETLLFFHPAVWYLSRQIDIVREECCDDLVLAQGGDALQYAASLLRVAELRLGQRVPPASALSADGGSPSELRRRIGRLLGIDSAPSMRLTRTGVAALLVALTVTLSLSWLVAAQDAETEPGHAGAIVRFADGVEAELVGVAFHPSENRDWWTGSGSPLGKAPAEKFGGHFSNLTPEQETQCRELWLEVRGAPVSVQSFVAVEGETQGSIGNMTYDSDRKLYTIRRAGGPITDRVETTIQLGLSIDDDLPLRFIGPDGIKSVAEETPAKVRRLDDIVEFLRIETAGAEEVELVVKPVGLLQKQAGIEFLAIDAEGREIRSHSSSGYQDANGFRFKVPRERLAKFAYRLRPYTHRATFKGVSLQPGKRTEIGLGSEIDAALLPPSVSAAEQLETVRQLQKLGVLSTALGKFDGHMFPVHMAKTPVPVLQLHLVGPTPQTLRLLDRFADLEDLTIWGAKTSDGIETLSRLKRLKRLELLNFPFVAEDFRHLRSLKRLESFTADLAHELSHDLDWYKQRNPDPTPEQLAVIARQLKQSENAERLCYVAFENDEALKALESLPALKDFKLTNAYLSDAGFRRITACRGLRNLEVGGGLLTETGLASLIGCGSLQSVDIGWAPWTPAALRSLESLRSLRTVRLSIPSVRIDPSSLAQLKVALPQAEITVREGWTAIPSLEFRLVAQLPESELGPQVPADWKERRYRAERADPRDGLETGFAWFSVSGSFAKSFTAPIMAGDAKSRRVLLSDRADEGLLTADSWAIQDAKVVDDPSGRRIRITLDAEGGERLRKLTREHTGAPLAILIGQRVVMAPVIRSEIGRSLEISGSFSDSETAALMQTLRRGIAAAGSEPGETFPEVPIPESAESFLDREVRIEASDRPLIFALSDLEKTYGLPITVDLREFRRLGVSPHQRVSLSLSGVSMRSALKILLESADSVLGFAETDNGVRIPGQDSSGDRELHRTKVVSRKTGGAVSGADVLVEYRDADWRVQRDTALPGGYQPPLAVRRLRTDENGEVPLLLPKICEGRDIAVTRHVAHPDFVVLTSSGYRPLQRAMLDQPDELARSFGQIALEEGRLVEGEVLYASGEPAGEVPVYAAREYIDYLGSSPLTLTDSHGKFRVRIPAANEKTWIVVLPWASVDRQSELVRLDQPLLKGWPSIGDQPENDFAGVSIPVPPKLPLRPITLSPGVRIQGRVLGGKGRGVPNVAVQGNGGDSVFHGQESPLLMARTDGEGRYTLPPSPSDRTIDVRVRDEGWFGPWQRRGTIVKEAYLPARAAADMAGNESGNRTVDFRPVPSVKLTARCFNGDQPRTSAHLEFYGSPPGRDDMQWRGRFHDVPGQPGTFELIVPRGLTDAALDLWQDGNDRTSSATRVAHAGERKAGERVDVRYPAVERDDDTIEIRSPARSK